MNSRFARLSAVASLLLAVSLLSPTGSQAEPAQRAVPGPGPYGTAITLGNNVDLNGYDVAVAANGTAYVGWIGSDYTVANRLVYLCILPKGASACQGGIKQTASFGASNASGLKVVIPSTGIVTLVWIHNTPGPDNISISQVQPDGSLGAGVQVANAPTNGRLLDAVAAPGGGIWAVVSSPAGETLAVHPGLGLPPQPITLPADWLVGTARLGFSGTQPVLVFDRGGAISESLRVTRQSAGVWSAPATVSKTWNVGGAFDLGTATSGLRLVAPINNASYYPQIARWTGSAFGPFTLTGDKNPCPRYSHDLYPDASGRLADVTFECTQLTVANHAKAGKAAHVRFNAGGTPTYQPQIASLPRGTAWVVWSRQAGTTGHRLLVTSVRLPALAVRKSRKISAGKVTVVGPVSCMPAVGLKVAVKTKPGRGWKLASKSLKLDGRKQGGTLNGIRLGAGSNHTLKGSATFKKGGQRKTVTTKLSFKACPNP